MQVPALLAKSPWLMFVVCISDVGVWKFILRDLYPAGLHYWKLWFGWPSGVKLDSEY